MTFWHSVVYYVLVRMNKKLPKIIVLLGPTASGKSFLSIKLAREFGCEIINADSRQVYKELSIGTAKPLGDWRSYPQTGEMAYMVEDIPHYLMDVVDVLQAYTVAEWKNEAEKRAQEILGRGRRVLIVGGTGLYIQSLVDNFDLPPQSTAGYIRSKLQSASKEELVKLLKKNDFASFEKIDIQNPRRVSRALEVVLSTGKSFVAQKNKKPQIFDVLQIGARISMDDLANRINERVDVMMKEGFLEEVETLFEKGYSDTLPALQSVGYRELWGYKKGEMSLEEAIERIKILTRQYAKRQMTWFKKNSRIQWASSYIEAHNLTQSFYKKN